MNEEGYDIFVQEKAKLSLPEYCLFNMPSGIHSFLVFIMKIFPLAMFETGDIKESGGNAI
jgi:hypothetical protein